MGQMQIAGDVLGGIGGLMQSYGERQRQRDQNQYYQDAARGFQLFDQYNQNPWGYGQLMQNAAMANPMLAYAMYGQGIFPTNTAWNARAPYEGFQTGPGSHYAQLANIVQNPGYIDPELRNRPLHLSAARENQDLTAAAGRLGRSNLQGGLAQGYNLASTAARTQRDVGTEQQYALWREQQRRADIAWAHQQWQNALNQAMGAQQGVAQYNTMQREPINWWQIGGQGLQSAGMALGGNYHPSVEQAQAGMQAGGGRGYGGGRPGGGQTFGWMGGNQGFPSMGGQMSAGSAGAFPMGGGGWAW